METAAIDDLPTSVQRLAELERELTIAATRELDGVRARELAADAEVELAPFALRLGAEARDRARMALYDRLAREAAGLPAVSYD